jgi:hypothetical protein
VKCSNKTDNTTRITSLWVPGALYLHLVHYEWILLTLNCKLKCRDLSNSFLNGAMSKNFTLLTALENL